MRDVGSNVRWQFLQGIDDSFASLTQDMVLSTISRALFHNDIKMAQRLIQCSSLARRFLMVQGRTVILREATQFADLFAQSRRANIGNEIENAERMPTGSKSQRKENRLSHLYRVIRMWVPIHRAKFVVGICKEDQV
eukprot:9043317-Karenia_brevis.AAC.1